MKDKKYIVLDIETTGFDKEKDEILQISMIDQDGEIVFNEYIKPVKKTSWPEAERVHHITDAMVKNCESLNFYKSKLEQIFHEYEYLVTYNGESFDIPFMKMKGIDFGEIKQVDVMKEYAKRNKCKWQKLSVLAKRLGFDEESYHDSLTDVRATLYVYERM